MGHYYNIFCRTLATKVAREDCYVERKLLEKLRTLAGPVTRDDLSP